MKYGKIRIEDGFLVFTRHMMINNLPCKDIVWAYMRKEGADEGDDRQLSVNYLVIVTRRKKRYKFDMTEKEIHECIRILKILNPDMATGFPKGGRISLQSLPNTRDLGAIVTADDRHILPRRLLRSGELYHISESDKNRLREEYNLKTVIDLRSAEERKCKPDTIMAEVEYYHVPVVDEDVQVISNREQFVKMLAGLPDDIEEYMIRQYRNLCMDQLVLKQYARFIDILFRQEKGAVLWHCGTGKDRTGIGAAFLLSLLGVEEDVIYEDYLRTNRYMEPKLVYMQRLVQTWPEADEKMTEKLPIIYNVKEEYLAAVFETVKKTYGSMEKFFQNVFYLKPKMIEEFRNKYLI